MTDRIPYKGRNLEIFTSAGEWMVEIIDAQGMRSVVKAPTIERAVNAAYQKIDEDEAAIHHA